MKTKVTIQYINVLRCWSIGHVKSGQKAFRTCFDTLKEAKAHCELHEAEVVSIHHGEI